MLVCFKGRIGAANRGGWSGDLSKYVGYRLTGTSNEGGGYSSEYIGG